MTEPIHDFTAKLRQPSLVDAVGSYVRWRRALARARATGAEEPRAPRAAPISINLDLTTACNYRCDHCIDWEILNTRPRHDVESLRRSLRQQADAAIDHGDLTALLYLQGYRREEFQS